MADDRQDNALDPTDPYQRQAQTFPKLIREQIERVGRFGETEDYPKGTQLFRRGDRSVDFFVVVQGSVEITDAGTDGREEAIHLPAGSSSPAGTAKAWPSPYATERPGIFAVGDVRSGSTKRVASGVGEGSVVVSSIHAYLADLEKLQ